ncbi:MAG: 2-oxoacid:acceptor oxidoreductase subunit alpha [Candidatus Sumerlaeales bacterium]|nr:2-oxoacid:acceptor oxidoreductase subunit alpha [Candidatus Sumerlaeales bacterium]
MNSLTIRIEGDSGDGILTLGKTLARVFARTGYHAFTYSSFLPVVRGGQVAFQLRVSDKPLLSQGDLPDIAISLNDKATENFSKVLTQSDALLIYPPPVSPDLQTLVDKIPTKKICVDLKKISSDTTGSTRSLNFVAAGFVIGTLNKDSDELTAIMKENFKTKSPSVVEANAKAIDAGFSIGRQHIQLCSQFELPPSDKARRLLLTGNETIALGALCAGVRFFAGYPITPASEIMEWLAKHLPMFGGKMIQAEDEIASLGMCIGASFGGVKAMTATSGPGLSLMTELIGLAGTAEIPLVIVDVQRAGPSTGMPTKDSQADLNLAIHGTHGEVPRVVIAPQTVNHCFYDTLRAVNIAHEFHIPVIILSSQSLSHRMQTIDIPEPERILPYAEEFYKPTLDENGEIQKFVRFATTTDGRPSPRSIPGTPHGMYRCGGLEHNQTGNPTSSPQTRTIMVERRRERMHAIERAFTQSIAVDHKELEKGKGQPIGILSWGTTASTLREVLKTTSDNGWEITAFRPRILWPLPDALFRKFLSAGFTTLFVIEQNATRQMAELVKGRYAGLLAQHEIKVVSLCKDDGTPFTHDEILRMMFDSLSKDMEQTQTILSTMHSIKQQLNLGGK